jgi:hypothetical protein
MSIIRGCLANSQVGIIPFGIFPEASPVGFLGKPGKPRSARSTLIYWSERRDLNSGPPVPQTGALTGLRYAPNEKAL